MIVNPQVGGQYPVLPPMYLYITIGITAILCIVANEMEKFFEGLSSESDVDKIATYLAIPVIIFLWPILLVGYLMNEW